MAPLTILWRDAHLVAVYKPAGWLVHRTGLDAGETRIVLQTLRDQLGGVRVHPVHRLDKGTCGVLLFALDPHTARAMTEAFTGRRVRKRYLALVRGWAPEEARVDHPLVPEDEGAGAAPQPARTHFRRFAHTELDIAFDERFPTTRASLVEAIPETGRRHQVRRHLKHLGHPILGDATHGKGPLNRWWAPRLGTARLWLHAWSLEFTHPVAGQPVRIESGLEPGSSAPDGAIPEDLAGWHRMLALHRWTRT